MGTLGKRWTNTPETIANRVASRYNGAGFSPSPETKDKIRKTCLAKKLAPPPHPSRFANEEERKANDRKNQKKWAENNPEKLRAAQVKYLYNLIADQHQEILKNQNFHCAINGCPATVDLNSPIDHNHRCCPGKRSCGKCIRGILCNRHNVGLAHFQDNTEELHGAVEYLDRNRL